MPWYIVPPGEWIQYHSGWSATVLTNIGLTPYATKAEAEQAKSHGGALNQVLHPSQAKAQEQLLQQNAQQQSGGALGWLQSNMVRLVEILAGLVLVGIGLNSMLKGKPLTVVTGPAGKLAKVVP